MVVIKNGGGGGGGGGTEQKIKLGGRAKFKGGHKILGGSL